MKKLTLPLIVVIIFLGLSIVIYISYYNDKKAHDSSEYIDSTREEFDDQWKPLSLDELKIESLEKTNPSKIKNESIDQLTDNAISDDTNKSFQSYDTYQWKGQEQWKVKQINKPDK